MIKIRHSPGELEISGTTKELTQLHDAVINFITHSATSTDITAEMDFDPSPYQQALHKMELSKTSGLFLASARNNTLHISGDSKHLELFAKNLPINASQPCHVHFDRIGRENSISTESLEIVLTAK